MKISKILYGLNVAIDNLDAVKMTKDVRSQLVSLHSWKERLENRMSRPVSIYEQYQFLQWVMLEIDQAKYKPFFVPSVGSY